MTDAIEAIYPLSPTQQGMLFHTISAPESGVYVGQVSCRLRGEFSGPALEAAWQRLLERHSALRTSFVWRRVEEPRQVVHRDVRLAVQRLDWTKLPADEHQARLEAFARADRQRGFDVARAPLMRVTLIKLDDRTYQFIWTQHHLLLDGWCQHLLLRECFALYDALHRGGDVALPPARPYRDYIAWLRRQKLEDAEAFWRRTLRGLTAPTTLSVDRHAGQLTATHASVRDVVRSVPESTTAALRELARQNRLTLNTVVQGAWALLLSRYSGEEDVVFGVVVSGRPVDLPGAESMVGLFVNTLPQRVAVPPDALVLPWLAALQLQQAEMSQYEHSPLVQVQSWSDVPRGRPLFESIFLFQNYPPLDSIEERIGDIEVSEVRAVDHTSYPLAVFAAARGRTLSLRISHDPSRFATDTVERMLEHLETLLAEIAAHPRAKVARLSMLPPGERERVLARWNDTARSFPGDRCVHHLFEAQVARTPDRVAAAFGACTVTYAALDAWADRLARHLRALGVGPEVPVGLCVDRSLELVAGVLGILKAGGAYVPLDPSYPAERLRFMLGDVRAPVLLTQDRLRGRLPESGARVVCLDAGEETWERESAERPADDVTPDNLAYVIYTSGSTGRPKGVAMGHRSLVNLLDWQLCSSTPGGGARTLQFASPSFDVCFQEIFSTLCSGGTLILVPDDVRRDPAALIRQLAVEEVERLFIPFTGLQQLGEAAGAETGGPSVIADILTAGEQLHVTPAIARWLTALGGCRLHNQYGPTESHVVTAHILTGAPAEWAVRAPIGRPIANVQIYVLDRAGDPVPVGVPGELHIGGVALARGYHRRPDLTAERFIPNRFASVAGARLYRTGDLARWQPDGTLEFLGRLDHQVKIRGFRIELGEIEAVLAAHPLVREAVVVAAEGASGADRLVGYVVADGAARPTTSDLRQHLLAELPEHMVPAAFVLLDALPLSPNGKVDRRQLPAPDASRPELGEMFVAPRTPVEAQLAAIWGKVLGLDRVGVHDNFFELGGDSILSIQIVAKANQAGLTLSPRQIFLHQTIAELAPVAGQPRAIRAEQGVVTGPVPLTPIQRWFFAQDYPEPHQCNMAVLLEVREELDPKRLALALEHVLVHHDALRLRYHREDGDWAQVNTDAQDLAGSVRVDVVDLAERSPEEQAAALEARAAAVQASLHIGTGPVLRLVLFRMGAMSHRLLIVAHHLVVDGVSWRIIFEDVMTAYAQLGDGEAVRLAPKTTSFRHWAERLHAYAQSAVLAEEAPYWLGVVRGPASPLPRDHEGGVNDGGSSDTVQVALTAEETRALVQDVPAAYRTQINDVLLTALAQAFARFTGDTRLLLDLEGHGREELFEGVDLSRTVGWFTALFPVRLDLEGAADPGAALRAVKEQLRGIPRRGIGYGLLRYVREDAALRRALAAGARAEVTFNYLGRFDQLVPEGAGLALAEESSGPALGPSNERAYLVDINGGITGGRLITVWRYSRRAHERATIERVAGDFISALRALIAHCQSPEAGGYTPSDFPLARLDQATLDQLVGDGRGIEDVYPLSPMQAGLLFHSLYAGQSAVYFEQVSCTLDGTLDVAAFRKAWQRLVDRHVILRTSFAWEGLAEPLQIVHHQASIPIEELDWRDLGAGDQARRTTAHLAQDLARGFDLTTPPLMRVALIRLAEASWTLVWSRHHLLLDGWSGPLLLAQWLAAYEAYASGQGVPLDRPRPYRDFIAWLQAQDTGRAETFWRRMLEGITAPTPLVITREEGSAAVESEEYARHDAKLSAAATAALEQFARRHQITVNTLVQGAWALLLGRYSGEAEVVFGVTVSGRPPELTGIESMLGVFINTLPLRVRVDGETDVLSWLRALQARLAELRQYEWSPLVQIQGWSDVPRGLPLFESMVVFENYPIERSLQDYRGSVTFRDGRFHVRTNYPITVAVVPGPALEVYLLYDRRRVPDDASARMLRHFQALLEGLVETPGRRLLSDVPMLSAEEERRLLVEAGAPEPRAVCLHQGFEAQAECTPEALAVVAPGEVWTYAVLDARANQIAHRLIALGAGPDDLVAVCLERTPQAVAALLGVLKAGATCALLDPEDAAARWLALLGGGRPVAVLTDERLRDRVSGIADAVVSVQADAEAPAAPATGVPPLRSRPASIAYVDGTGGRGVLVEHRAAVHRLELLQRELRLDAADTILSTVSPATESFVLDCVLALGVGARVVLVPDPVPSDGAGLVRLIADVGATVHLARHEMPPSPAPGSRRIRALWGAPEAGWIVADGDSAAGPRRIRRSDGMAIHVLDRDLRPVPEGLWGEICLGGEGLARGYLGDAQETRDRFVEGAWAAPPAARVFRTGERGRVLGPETIEIAGAGGAHAWIGGLRVEHDRVAGALLEDPSVEDCAVLVREAAAGGIRIVAYVVGRGEPACDELRARLEAILPAALVPRVLFVPVASIPLTAGRVDEAALCRLDVVDAGLIARWEEQLNAVPGVDRAVVVREADEPSCPPLHLEDVLPRTLRPSTRRVASAPDEPASAASAVARAPKPSGVPAESHGEPPRQDAAAPRTLPEALRRAARAEPLRGLVYIRADGAERAQSYAELLQAAERMLHGLRRIGLEPGDRVILQLNHNEEFVPAFWACVLGGLVPVPVSIPPTYQGDSGALNKLAQAWAMLGRPVVLAGGELAPEIRAWAMRAGLEGFRLAPIGELAGAAPDHDWHQSRPEDVALILLTSGSTGRPKGVMLTHANMLSRSAATSQMNGFTAGDVSLNWFPLDHVGGIVMFHVRDVSLGCRQIQAPTELVLREPLRWLDWIDRHGVTVTWAPNFAYALINEQAAEVGRRRWNLSSLRFILNGGEAVVAKTARAFLALLAPHGLAATAMHPAWGMSETSSAVTYSHRFTLAATADDQRFVEVGAPIPGVSVRIVDDADRVVEMGAIGRLQVTGPTVTCGYYDDEALTRETFTSDGWLKTGDIGYLDGGRLTITGREKDIIIVNGVNFYCHEIEAATEEVPGVAASFSAACAVRRPGDDTDRLAIFWSRGEEGGDGDGALPLAVMELIRERVLQRVGVRAEYVVPVDRGDIPKTGIGKIQRSVLRDRFGAGDFDDILKRIDIEAGTANTVPDWFYTRVWCRREAPAAPRPSAGRPAMVLLDGLGLGERLCDELDAAGPPAIRVEMGGEFARLDSRRYRIAPGDREHYRLLLAAIAGASPPIEQIVHLSTYDERAGAIEGADTLDAAKERGAVSLLWLVQALAEARSADEMSRVDLLVVSSHAQPVSPADPIAPEKGLMLGLLRTIPHELPWLACRHLDLPVTAAERNVRMIRRELRTAAGDQEIAYRDGRRLVPRLRKVGFPRSRAAATLCVQTGGMYVITGGLGGIGTALARYLLERCDARVLLIGRTVLPPRDTWIAHLAQGDAIASRLEAYLGLERAGGQIAYEALDVADATEVRSAIERWESRWRCRLAGIMHLAGVLQERLLVEETREGLAASLRPKMLGSVALDTLLAERPQCRIVHFASANGLFGGATMGAYAAANCFLQSVSHAQNLRAAGSSACLSWTVWDGVGMSREYVAKEQGRAKGYRSISVEQGLYSLLVGLSHAEPSLVVGLDGANRNIRRMVAADGGRLWRLAAYVTPATAAPLRAGREIVVHDGFGTPSECDVVGIPALPLTEGGEVDREQLAQFRRGTRRVPVDHVLPRTEIERRIARIWQDVLRLPQVGIHDNFFELGGDSILAIQAISRANQAGLRFTPAQLFQHQTVAGLAAVSGEGAEARADQGPVTGPVPLTPIQHWFFDQDLPEPHQFNMALLLTVSSELDPALVEAAVGRIVIHHDALRLRFARDGSGWRQWIADPEEAGVCPVFTRQSLADLPEPAKAAAIEVAAAELESSLDLERGPLLRVAYFDLGPGCAGRLLMIVHHLAVDGVSWRILLEDLLLAYQQLSRGMAVVLPPKTTSFKTWARRLAERAASGGVDGELAHWLSLADGPVASLPRDHAGGANTVGLARSVSVSLAQDETEVLLQRVPAVYHTQINDVLLTALGAALARWTGERVTVIDLEGHGREEVGDGVDLSRTVGWFTALFPVRLDQPRAWSPGPALQSVKEQLRRVPSRGVGFGLLRHLGADCDGRERLRALPSPEISFNYLGQLDAAIPAGAPFGLALAPESAGPTASVRAPRPHLLDVVALVTGGCLRVDWAFGSAVHEPATIERLARDFLDRLREIIAHCQSPEAGGYTPSDFPLAKLDEEQLDTLLAQVEFEGDGSE